MAEPLLVLGSASPRRAELLTQLGLTFEVRAVDIDEEAVIRKDDNATDAVARIAEAKFDALTAVLDTALIEADSLVMTADTLVACRGKVLGKPRNNNDLAVMLQEMSSATLHISTGVCIAPFAMKARTQTVTTSVRLRELTEADISTYVATGTGLDKAAGLSLQGEANNFIEMVEGCWSNVMGLPLCAVRAGLNFDTDKLVRTCTIDVCGTGQA